MMDVQHLTPEALAAIFDHTLLRASASLSELAQLCAEARQYGFGMVAINSAPVAFCRGQLEGSPVHVGAAVSFPLGQTTLDVKLFETEKAIRDGADEIDMVIHIGWLKDRRYDDLLREIQAVKDACGGKILKVIIETCLLTEEEKIKMCEIVTEARADFIKTSTGFSTAGATLEDVALFKAHVGPAVQIKAAGGIASLQDAEKFLELGATRLGTSRIVKLAKAME